MSSETHFPLSVFVGKTGFRLLSSRNDQRRRRHGPKDSISFFGKKSSLFHQKSIFQRDFTVTPYRPTAALRTPNNPPYTRDEPGTNCGRWGWRFASLRFPRPPPTTTAHLHLPYTCTYTLPGPGSECYPLTLNVAFSEANSSVLVHFEIWSRGERGSGVRTSRPRYWPVIRPGAPSIAQQGLGHVLKDSP